MFNYSQDELVIVMPDIPVQTAVKDSVLSMQPGLTKPQVCDCTDSLFYICSSLYLI